MKTEISKKFCQKKYAMAHVVTVTEIYSIYPMNPNPRKFEFQENQFLSYKIKKE